MRTAPAVLLLSLLLCSCASTPPGDLKAAVRVLNVYKTGQEALPRQIEGCAFLGSASASVPEAQANSITTGIYDPTPLLETIRSRAYRKGADTAFVSIGEMQVDERVLRATIFHCGESQIPMTLGAPVFN